jgi:hypothetical protein
MSNSMAKATISQFPRSIDQPSLSADVSRHQTKRPTRADMIDFARTGRHPLRGSAENMVSCFWLPTCGPTPPSCNSPTVVKSPPFIGG